MPRAKAALDSLMGSSLKSVSSTTSASIVSGETPTAVILASTSKLFNTMLSGGSYTSWWIIGLMNSQAYSALSESGTTWS